MRYSHLVLVLLTASCGRGTWIQHRIDEPTAVASADPVLIWSGGKVEKWHAVVITSDSVSGIPYQTSLTCDTCRRSLPRSQVDSMVHGFRASQGGQPIGKTLIEGAGVAGAALLLEYVWCSSQSARHC